MTAVWTKVSHKCVLVRHIYFSGHAVRQKQTKCYSCSGSNAVMYSALHTKTLQFTVHLCTRSSNLEFRIKWAEFSTYPFNFLIGPGANVSAQNEHHFAEMNKLLLCEISTRYEYITITNSQTAVVEQTSVNQQ